MTAQIWKLIKAVNLNRILFILGGLGVFAPDVLNLAASLATVHLAFLVPVVKVLGWVATAMGGLAIAIPKLRVKLAALGLATSPGALAPWNPDKGPQPAIVPLLDGSSVIQVKAPTVAGQPSLMAVATDVRDVAKLAGAVPSRSNDDTPVTTPIRRPRDSGIVDHLALPLVLGLALGMMILCMAGKARADVPSRQFGGCIIWQDSEHTVCKLEAGPSVAVTVGKYEGGKFSAGLLPGIGYGVVLFPAEWYALGLAAYGQLIVGNNANQAAISGLFSFANYVRFGVGETWTEQAAGSALRSTAYLFGLGSDFGGNPSYIAKQQQRAVQADRAQMAAQKGGE